MVSDAAGELQVQDVRAVDASDLPAIDADTAALLRLARDPRLAEWLGETFRLEVRSVGNLRKAMQSGGVLLLDLTLPGGAASLILPSDLLPALAMAIEAEGRGAPPIATLAASHMLASTLERFGDAAQALGDARWQAIGIASVRLLGAGGNTPVPKPVAAWDVTLANRLHARMALIAIDAEPREALQDMLSMRAVRQQSWTASWRVASMLRFATRKWTSTLLHSLETGDVLLCSEDADLADMEATLFCGAVTGNHLTARVRINQRKVTIMSDMQADDGRLDAEQETLAPPLASGVAELEVPVHFELDSAALSLAELASLRPGYVIELSIPVAQAEIRVLACGQVIGRGKLVVIGDCLGVQLERLETGSP